MNVEELKDFKSELMAVVVSVDRILDFLEGSGGKVPVVGKAISLRFGRKEKELAAESTGNAKKTGNGKPNGVHKGGRQLHVGVAALVRAFIRELDDGTEFEAKKDLRHRGLLERIGEGQPAVYRKCGNWAQDDVADRYAKFRSTIATGKEDVE